VIGRAPLVPEFGAWFCGVGFFYPSRHPFFLLLFYFKQYSVHSRS